MRSITSVHEPEYPRQAMTISRGSDVRLPPLSQRHVTSASMNGLKKTLVKEAARGLVLDRHIIFSSGGLRYTYVWIFFVIF